MASSWAPRRFVGKAVKRAGSEVTRFVDTMLPHTKAPISMRRRQINSKSINGEYLDESNGSIYSGNLQTIEKSNNKVETALNSTTDPSARLLAQASAHLSYKVGKPLMDTMNGIRSLFITNAFLSVWYFICFATLLIYRCIIVSEGTTSILTIFLTTSFSIFDQPNHMNQFYPIIWQSSSYLIDIPLLIVFAVATLGCLIRWFSIFRSAGLFDSDYDVTYGVGLTIFTNNGTNLERIQESALFFDDATYTEDQLNNFYIKQVISGANWFRWVEWFVDGGALLWAIMTLSPIQDVFLLVTLLMVYAGILALAFLHEHINRVKTSNIDLANPIGDATNFLGTYVSSTDKIVKRRPITWWAFVLGVLLNAWLWTVIFFYYGYADNLNPGAFQWFRLAAVPIVAAFYFVIVPLTILIWTLSSETSYYEFDQHKPTSLIEAAGSDNEDNLKEYLATHTEKNTKHVNPNISSQSTYWKDFGDKSFFEATDEQQQRMNDFFIYQNWNKNYIYEIVMLVEAAVCKTLVIWIIWGGMLRQ